MTPYQVLRASKREQLRTFDIAFDEGQIAEIAKIIVQRDDFAFHMLLRRQAGVSLFTRAVVISSGQMGLACADGAGSLHRHVEVHEPACVAATFPDHLDVGKTKEAHHDLKRVARKGHRFECVYPALAADGAREVIRIHAVVRPDVQNLIARPHRQRYEIHFRLSPSTRHDVPRHGARLERSVHPSPEHRGGEALEHSPGRRVRTHQANTECSRRRRVLRANCSA